VPGPERVVVVGGGLSAVRLLEELRGNGATSALTLVSAESSAPYDRPPLSKDVLRGQRDVSWLRPEWESLEVDLRLGTRAVALDSTARTVLLDNGDRLEYDALVIATGATPRTLPGIAGPGAHVLRTVEDALRLRADLTEGAALTVVGGGFIGCEVAASARALGVDVTLVELLAAPLIRVLGPAVAAEVAALHVSHGVRLRCGQAVVEGRGEGPERELLLGDGSVVPAGVVLVGLGVVPEIEWLAGSGVDVEDGVRCDNHGRTSVDGVWAAGDVAAWRDVTTGWHRRLEHWTSAAEQGVTVARDILGLPTPSADAPTVPYFWSDQYDVKFQMLGRPEPDDDVTLFRVGRQNDRLLALYGHDGVLSGVLGVSAARFVMGFRAAIAARSDYSAAVESVGGVRV
jgi:3-phenylpropionate/trans-cinnamate dioxygenase ferredoxin reductase subunit